tara:strand:+ start:60 stop:242 length:183 start_codon:yes stop_codon:yes gene_type:complete
MDDDLKDLLAMVFYDQASKSLFINITGFRNDLHSKDVSDWIMQTLNIDTTDYHEPKPTLH